ncbi:hypothetical protein [uncultured Algibacter sp.]|uniref:OB-fold protein n=1 Tax=uncultured Algibacter sp. TaxID=298659 RepID=UPI00260FC3A1|nr:hypothetical protein [uncultured Algibacter sp.]
MKKKILIIITLLAITLLAYNYMYQDHRDIASEEPEFSITPEQIVNTFKTNLKDSEKKYLNKTIELTGIVTESNSKDLTLNHDVFCQFLQNQNASLNANIKIKGRCIGYDDLLEQVKLDQCYIIN